MWFWVALAGASTLRAWLAWSDHSVFWPDEIYQSLEQAHRVAFGYGIVPWEFRDGARSWLFPGAIAALWKVASGAGIQSSLVLVLLARLGMVVASVAAIWFAAKLATAKAGARAGVAVAVILATFPPSMVFAYRAMSETASAPLVALGAWLLSRNTSRASLLSGLAIGVGCLLRYQNGLFALAFWLVLLLQRRHREALAFCCTGVAVALFGGLLDWLTWGRPFHSLLAYVDFNLMQGGASGFGVEPLSFYAATLWSSAGPMLLPLVVAFCVGSVAEPILGAIVVIYTLAHSVLPHKELRFLVPCLPLFATVAGIGVERVLRRIPAPQLAAKVAALTLTAGFAVTLLRLDYQDMGQYVGTARASTSIWQNEQEPTLLLADAGTHPDVCGVSVLGARAGFTGAYTYLHRDVPLLYQSELCDARSVNYVISATDHGAAALPRNFQLQAQRGDWGLYRRDGGCKAPEEADDRLLEGARDMGLVLQHAQQSVNGSLQFDLQRDSGAFSQGWGHGESLECQPARWAAGKVAVLEFEFNPNSRRYQIDLRARAHERALPQSLTLVVNGTRVRVGSMSPQLKSYSVDLPESALRAGHNRIEFSFARAARAGSIDTRELTALFRSIEIIPKRDDFSVDLALAQARPHLTRGFNADEREGGTSFAWSEGPVSEVEGTLAWPQTPYVLETLAEAVPLVASQRTRVFANDQPVGFIDFQHDWLGQRLLIPGGMLQKGTNRIRFEYQAAVRPAQVNRKLRDQRELAVRFRRIELTPLAALAHLDVGTPAARPFLLDGWSGDERDGERDAVWTDGPRASVVLSLHGVVRPVLRLRAQGYVRTLPIAVTVFLNGNVVGSFAAPDGWQDIAVPLPIADYSTAGEVLGFGFDHTLRPSRHDPKSADQRELALRVDQIWVEPAAASEPLDSAARAFGAGATTIPVGIATSR